MSSRLAILSALLFVTGCTDANLSLIGPSGSRCAVTLTNSMETAPAAGGAGEIAVTTARDCSWAASSAAAWVVLTSASSGQGDGTLTYRVAANQNPAGRDTTVEVNAARVTIAQASAECRFSLSPGAPIPADGGSTTVRVEPTANCAWTAAIDAEWLRITAGASATGAGMITVAADPNQGAARSATLRVAGDAVAIAQESGIPSPPAAPGCTYAVVPTGETLASAGGSGTIAVTAGPGCSWTAVPNVDWVAVSEGATGSGSGTVRFQVAANAGASRTGTIAVAGHVFTVTQGSVACNYGIAPSSASVAPGGGAAEITVTAGAACAWTAASQAPWIRVASGASATGNGTVRLDVSANGGAARSGTVAVAGQTFTVTQSSAPCAFTLTPAIVDVPAEGGQRSTNVTTSAGCSWEAVPNAAWITIAAGTSGNGNGAVTFNVAANAGAARNGTITIGGQTLTVTQQPAPCALTIDPSAAAAPAAGGGGQVTVTAGQTCPAWTAVSNNTDWLAVTAPANGNGSGTGAVTYTVAANTGPARTGTIAIGGRTFTLTQDAACTFAVAPTGFIAAAAGDTNGATVTTQAACRWTAVSNNPDWLTVVSGTDVTGPGGMTFTAAANAGPPRQGTITVAGQTFTVDQLAP